jgi:hypothetical protein
MKEVTMPGTRLDLKHWRFEIDFEKIGWAILDQAGESTNTLGTETATELERVVSAVEEAVRRDEIEALIFLSGRKNPSSPAPTYANSKPSPARRMSRMWSGR